MAESNEPKFSPAWWVPGAHAQTLWSQFFRRRRPPPGEMERVATPDRDHLYLCHVTGVPTKPRLVVLHGLEGSERSHYVAGLLSQAARRGWSATVLVFRGCGPELNAAPRMYHSGETTDLRFVIDLLIDRAPRQELVLAGVSLGGNVMLKWLGECGQHVPRQLRAAAAVSVPFDLEPGAKYLQAGFARVYDRHFLRSLRAKALRKLEQHPGLFDRARLLAASTIEDFDDAVTGPIHGFAGSHDYYEKSSSINWLNEIRIPTLLLNAADDPFLPAEVLNRVEDRARLNSCLRLLFTREGGHVGFVTGPTPFHARYWAEERLMAFLDSQLGAVPLAGRGMPV